MKLIYSTEDICLMVKEGDTKTVTLFPKSDTKTVTL